MAVQNPKLITNLSHSTMLLQYSFSVGIRSRMSFRIASLIMMKLVNAIQTLLYSTCELLNCLSFMFHKLTYNIVKCGWDQPQEKANIGEMMYETRNTSTQSLSSVRLTACDFVIRLANIAIMKDKCYYACILMECTQRLKSLSVLRQKSVKGLMHGKHKI